MHTAGRDHLNERSVRRRGRYLHNTQHKQNRRTSMISEGFDPAVPAINRS